MLFVHMQYIHTYLGEKPQLAQLGQPQHGDEGEEHAAGGG